jgi:hypothetical protein
MLHSDHGFQALCDLSHIPLLLGLRDPHCIITGLGLGGLKIPFQLWIAYGSCHPGHWGKLKLFQMDSPNPACSQNQLSPLYVTSISALLGLQKFGPGNQLQQYWRG